jgi:hypothetical protein
MRIPPWVGVFFLGSALLWGCQRNASRVAPDLAEKDSTASGTSSTPHSASGSATSDRASSARDTVTPFKLTISTGGGFTGAVSGCTLGSDGRVGDWAQQGAAPPSSRWNVQADRAKVIGFRRRLDAAFGLNLRKYGNMTTVVKLELPDTLRIWSWSGHGASETTPEPFRTWFPEVEAFCDSLGTTPGKSVAPSAPHPK